MLLKRLVVPMNSTRLLCLIGAFCFVGFFIIMSLLRIFSQKSLDYIGMRNEKSTQKQRIFKMPKKFDERGSYGFNKVLIEPANIPNKLLFLVLVTSSLRPIGKARRDAIRKTWANCYGEEISSGLIGAKLLQTSKSKDYYRDIKDYNYCRVVFSIGMTKNAELPSSVRHESFEQKDIFVSDVIDSYGNVTLKLRTLFNFFAGVDVKYIVKADSDVYINLPRLAKLIVNADHLPYFLYGGFPYSGTVVRDPKHRHFVHKEDYSEKYYPTFCKGSMVLISGNIFSQISKAFTHIKPFNIDDAYLGITLDKLGVPAFKIPQFVQFQHSPVMLEFLHLCDFSWLIGIGDGFSPAKIQRIHELMALADKLPTWMCLHFNHLGFFILVIAIFFSYFGFSKLLSHQYIITT